MRLLLASAAGILTGIYIKREAISAQLIFQDRAPSVPERTKAIAIGIGSGLFAGALSYWITGAIGVK